MNGMLLEVENLVSGYAGSRVLNGVSLTVEAGEAVALLGRNGEGKTTFMETIMGMVHATGGSVRVGGDNVTGRAPHVVSRSGVGIVPQGRRVFAPLTVEENLQIATRSKGGDWSIDRVYDTMPRLKERRTNLGSQLSGGEQQMLAIGRALLGSPRLMLLDEPSDGLAPAIVDQVGEILHELAGTGMAILLVEQDLRLAFSVADRLAVLRKGQIIHRSTVDDFRRDKPLARTLLGVG